MADHDAHDRPSDETTAANGINETNGSGDAADAGASAGAGAESSLKISRAHDENEHAEPVAGEQPEGEQRRVAGRIKVDGIRVYKGLSKGVVLDASAGGMRIKGKTPKGCEPGTILRLAVGGDDGAIELEAEVRWMQRHPLRGATFGVSFVDLSDECRRELFSIIRRAGTDTRCRWMAA